MEASPSERSAPQATEAPSATPSFKRILVPTDFSACSRAAIEVAIELAKRFHAKLTLLHAWDSPALPLLGRDNAVDDVLATDGGTRFEAPASQRLAALLAEVRKQLPDAESVVRQGAAVDEVLHCIEETNPDLVVMGTHGRHGFARTFYGSVAERIVRASPRPVLTVHEAKGASVHPA